MVEDSEVDTCDVSPPADGPSGSLDTIASQSSLSQSDPSARRTMLMRLFAPVDLLPLACFRIFFGAIMLYHVVGTISDLWVDFFYIRPVFHLTYPGFGWIHPWPGQGMYYHFGVMAVAAAGIMTGCLYRFSAAVFAVGFIYVFLLEKALYQNHYYLICLISTMMVFIPAHRMWSIDSYWRQNIRSQTVPAIWLWLLQLQIAIPYFYGGLAKLNYDWLHGMPMQLWLGRRSTMPVIGPWLVHDYSAMLFSWGGLIFDLLVVPALLWKRTRVPAYLSALAFHLTNSVLWEIGIFPWFMIVATLLYFPAATIRKALFQPPLSIDADSVSTVDRRQRITVGVVGVYVAWQLLFPFRHFLYPGNVSWTEEAHHFAWHMMLREKDVGLRLFAYNTTTGQQGLIKLRDFVGERQLSRMAKDPDMILEFVHFVRDQYRDHGQGDIEIRVLALASLNGRKPQLLVDPTIDYTKVDRVWGHQPWIIPLEEPLRKEGWNLPLADWDAELEHLIPEDMKQPPGH